MKVFKNMERNFKFNKKFNAAKIHEANIEREAIKKGSSHLNNAINLLRLATTQCEENLIKEAEKTFEESIVEILVSSENDTEIENRTSFLKHINEKSISELLKKINDDSDYGLADYLSTLINEDCYPFLRAIDKDKSQIYRIKSETLQKLLRDKFNPEP